MALKFNNKEIVETSLKAFGISNSLDSSEDYLFNRFEIQEDEYLIHFDENSGLVAEDSGEEKDFSSSD